MFLIIFVFGQILASLFAFFLNSWLFRLSRVSRTLGKIFICLHFALGNTPALFSALHGALRLEEISFKCHNDHIPARIKEATERPMIKCYSWISMVFIGPNSNWTAAVKRGLRNRPIFIFSFWWRKSFTNSSKSQSRLKMTKTMFLFNEHMTSARNTKH